MRPECSVFVGVSLDGFIARPDGKLDWLSEGDQVASETGDHGYNEFIAGIDALVMGRKTYETVLGFEKWPYDKKVFVLSTGKVDTAAAKAKGGDVEVMAGKPLEIVNKLGAAGFQNLYVDGGKTIQKFLQAGLIDRMIISRLPVLIGQGIPLFGSLPRDITLLHVSTRTLGGMVQSTYLPQSKD